MALSSTPRRRVARKTHLDASVVPVERAFLHRASVLQDHMQHFDNEITVSVMSAVAEEFRLLAEELHYW